MIITLRIKLLALHIRKIAYLTDKASHHIEKSDNLIEKTAIAAFLVFAVMSFGGVFIERSRLSAKPLIPTNSSASLIKASSPPSAPGGKTTSQAVYVNPTHQDSPEDD